jgi:predicted nucleotidyltransferase
MNFLIGNKLKQKLLTYVFTHPDESFYVRELAALIEGDPGNLSRELNKLEKDGLFRSATRGKAKYYSLNKAHPLFSDLKNMIFKAEGVAGSLKSAVDLVEGISLAFIYGSYARGEEKAGSDIDIGLVGQVPRAEITRQFRALEQKLNREINFTVYGKEEFERERKKAGGFLNIVLKEKIIILKGQLC